MSNNHTRPASELTSPAEIVTRSFSSLPSAAATQVNGSSYVLVVDDQDDNRALIVRYLTQAGYPVRQATNGAEAMAAIGLEKPGVILMDVIMPGVLPPEPLQPLTVKGESHRCRCIEYAF